VNKIFPFSPRSLWEFTRLEAISCIFPVFLFAALALTKTFHGLPFYRYDVLLVLCIGMQIAMVRLYLETKDELKAICLFHLVGLLLELFKTYMGSWSYPEPAYSKIFGLVPLYSGFMYASVASYICQAWRRFDLELSDHPRLRWTGPLVLAIYLNFFTHHLGLPDVRWWLAAGSFLVFGRTWVTYHVKEQAYRMPLFLSFILIGFFIYLAENIATFFGAWKYPNQQHNWQLVHASKFSSWFLLVIFSFILVAFLKEIKSRRF
jgi:uncharacterized membrane protein YoaT (DUF817 family)